MVIVGIDCEPCTPRPDTYIEEICSLLGVVKNEPVSKLFGAWTWEFEVEKEKYLSVKDSIQKYIVDKYNRGQIRGAFHSFEE